MSVERMQNTNTDDTRQIAQLLIGESCKINENDGTAIADVWRIHDEYVLFRIKHNKFVLISTYERSQIGIQKMLTTIYNWS